MQDIAAMVQSPAWWFQAVIVVVLANVISHALTHLTITIRWIDYALRVQAVFTAAIGIAALWTNAPYWATPPYPAAYSLFSFYTVHLWLVVISWVLVPQMPITSIRLTYLLMPPAITGAIVLATQPTMTIFILAYLIGSMITMYLFCAVFISLKLAGRVS
jgi:hypothetical protein